MARKLTDEDGKIKNMPVFHNLKQVPIMDPINHDWYKDRSKLKDDEKKKLPSFTNLKEATKEEE